MILRSIQVEGWRCFANPMKVGPFAEGLNILHAPNAQGKSTLFEALRRGFTDGHRVSGGGVEALRPWGRALPPTVVIEFAHGGIDYRLTKRFLDPLAKLERLEGTRYVALATGDEADEQVRSILACAPPGKGLAKVQHWGLAQILWAPQGELALEGLSSDAAAGVRASLGAQISSPDTDRLEERIEQAYLEIFTPGGKPRAGQNAAAPVVRLQAELATATQRLQGARSRQQEFEKATRRVENLCAMQKQAANDAEELRKVLEATRSQAQQYGDLVAQKELQEQRLRTAKAVFEGVERRLKAIKDARRDLAAVREEMAGRRRDLPLIVSEVEQREREAAAAEQVIEDLRKVRPRITKLENEAYAARELTSARQTAASLDERLKAVSELNAGLSALKRERAAVMAPDSDSMQAIRQAIKERDDARVRLDASLMTVEIVPAKALSVEVVAGERAGTTTIEPGRPFEVKGSPEVVLDIPSVGRLRARGPAGSGAGARRQRDAATEKLNRLTAPFGTTEANALEALQERARDLDQLIKEQRARLETWLTSEDEETLAGKRTAAQGLIERVLEEYPDWRAELPDPAALHAAAEETKQQFINQIEPAEAKWKSAQAALVDVGKKKAATEASLGDIEKRVIVLDGKLSELASDGKTDEQREAELTDAAIAARAAEGLAVETGGKLATFGDDPRQTVATLERQLAETQKAATDALRQAVHEEGQLQHISAQGPYSALVMAEEEVARLEDGLQRESLKAEAIKVLREVVQTVRNEVVEAVAAPVAKAASRMLQRVAGTSLGEVRVGETFEPVQVAPELAGGPVAIGQLSGGEKEQIHLVTRLALADVLAKDERHLVVFDDILTFTDAGRLARVLKLLEEAAQRLQVLVLTCHPERYRGLSSALFIDLLQCEEATAAA